MSDLTENIMLGLGLRTSEIVLVTTKGLGHKKEATSIALNKAVSFTDTKFRTVFGEQESYVLAISSDALKQHLKLKR